MGQDRHQDLSAAEEDSYRDGVEVDSQGEFRESGDVRRSHGHGSSPMTDQRR